LRCTRRAAGKRRAGKAVSLWAGLVRREQDGGTRRVVRAVNRAGRDQPRGGRRPPGARLKASYRLGEAFYARQRPSQLEAEASREDFAEEKNARPRAKQGACYTVLHAVVSSSPPTTGGGRR